MFNIENLLIGIFIFWIFACWGSFLNVLAYRVIFEEKFNIFSRSHCPNCKKVLSPFELIPIFSWLYLKRACKACKSKISGLYPFIEVLTGSIFTILIYKNYGTDLNFLKKIYLNLNPLIFSFIYISALIVSIRTDLESMLLSRYFTIFLVPLGLLVSILRISGLSLSSSVLGAVLGFGALFIVKKTFWIFTKKEALGDGDIDLLCMIGAFTGPLGVYTSVLIGSIFGSLIGLFMMYSGQLNRNSKIPFGPFLAIGSIIWVVFKTELCKLLL